MDWNGLLNFQDDPQRNMLMQVGLGLLAGNQSGNPAMGAMRGFQNAQEMQNAMQRQKFLDEQIQMQRDEYGLRKSEYDRRIAEDQKRQQSIQRLLGGQGAYTTEQEVPVQSFQNVPIPAVEGAQAPNFGTTRESITTMQKKPVFDQSQYTQDLIAAGMGDDLIRQQFTPKKTTWQDVGGEFVQIDESGNPTGKKMPKSMAPKEPQIFTIKEGRTENQYYGSMSDPSTWQLVGRSSMDAPRQPDKIGYKTQEGADGNLYYVPDRPGSPVLDVNGQPAQNFKPKSEGKSNLTGEQKNQLSGIDALSKAVDEYTNQLDKWNNLDLANPAARAEMGIKYNNLMLQAKEAYRLGVLNGPDLSILESVVTDPRSFTGAVTPNSSLKKQATELKRIMNDVAEGMRQAERQQNQVNILPPDAPMPDLQAAAQEELKRRRGGK